MKQNVIAIDGPAGAGKSTVARQVAARLGFTYIDTGAMYRAVTCRALRLGIAGGDREKLAVLAKKITVRLEMSGDGLRVWADGSDVTAEIRDPVVTATVPAVSQVAEVRQAMVRLQRELAMAGRAVLDGRDIGTVVTPQACTKIFLTASPTERAKRRYLELQAKGYTPELSVLQAEIAERDRLDSERDLAPLVQAADAVLVDTDAMTIEAVVERIIQIYYARCKNV